MSSVSQTHPADQEKQWIRQTATGNHLAFQLLYERYHRALYRYALRFVKSPELAQDIVQDTFVKIWEKKADLTHIQHFRAFLFIICRNQMMNLFARATRETTLRQEITYYTLLAQENTEDPFADTRYESIVAEAIDRLPPQRQQVFRLCRLEGRTYEEVAQAMGISRNTVSDHLVKANKFLRDYLANQVDYSLLVFLLPYLFLE